MPEQNVLGERPVRMRCPNCNADILTDTYTRPGGMAYIAGLLICLLGCWWGCCLIPCMMSVFQITEHYCPNCNVYIGTYKSL